VTLGLGGTAVKSVAPETPRTRRKSKMLQVPTVLQLLCNMVNKHIKLN